MNEPPLSARERRVLAEIEEQLERDETLARSLRTMRRSRRDRRSLSAGARLGPSSDGGARHRLPRLAFAGLGALSLTLFVLAVATEAAPLIWLFAGVWIVTLASLARLVGQAFRRWSAGWERSETTERTEKTD
ncbi:MULTISPECIES: hypothetical protein [unclassified Streptomyces]|uniref:hypothetical protein n=1 Tax=unclassified Streptomyces TaxID=2593676 RepID=UPI0016610EDF|nr:MULTISPECIES: hypothetical protein [unclassified Streptomyces]MBD0708273.1 hypothetical protein [Streptomyces sp. CBMA291]MBD0716512.1 hypothetical protein [Streptomyces sp. CBMA370]